MRNLHTLSDNSMLNLSGGWLSDEAFVNTLTTGGDIAVGMLAHLVAAHDGLAEIEHNRSVAEAKLREYVTRSGVLDERHDSTARGLNYILRGLSDIEQDPVKADRYRELESILYPHGLSVTRLSYAEEGGAAIALEDSISPELRAEFAAITVGGHSLESILDTWLEAGRELGKTVKRRVELRASLSRKGSANAKIDISARRQRWLKAVRGLLWAIDMEPKLAALDEPVTAVLEDAIQAELSGLGTGAELDQAGEEFDEDEAEFEGEDELDSEAFDDEAFDEAEAPIEPAVISE